MRQTRLQQRLPGHKPGVETARAERVLITGASSGIGLATAIAYGRRGARVALLARGEDGLESAAAQAGQAGAETFVLPADVADRQALGAAVDAAVEALGGLDVTVASAVAAAYGRFTDTDAEDFDRTVATTLTGTVNTTRAVLPALECSGGSMVLVGSIAARMPLPLFSAYATAKHGLRGFADALRVELAEQRSAVSLSLVSPGPVDTPLWSNLACQSGSLPASFPGSYRPEDVAAAIIRCTVARNRGTTVGGAAALIQALSLAAAPLADRVMRAAATYSLAHGRPCPERSPFDRSIGGGRIRGDLPAARRSVLRAISGALSR